ncbi:hypothetical protein C8T65DRAFT_651105 [Cerioporus squamosus]|nr:hypothetical protein C8T65DRAFT_651105 [Cerioporus squamosus]
MSCGAGSNRRNCGTFKGHLFPVKTHGPLIVCILVADDRHAWARSKFRSLQNSTVSV